MKLADEIGAVVYSLFDADDNLLYVGCTTQLKKRLRAHAHHRRMSPASVQFIGPFEVGVARRVEYALIAHSAPLFNKLANVRRGYYGVRYDPEWDEFGGGRTIFASKAAA